MQRWIFKQNTVYLIFYVEYVWWLLVVARPLTIYLTVQHLQNAKVLAIVSDVATLFKRSMSTPGDIFVWDYFTSRLTV